MKKLLIVLLVAFSMQLNAQNWELGLNLGASIYQGDIVEPSIATDNAQLAYGLFIQRNFSDKVGVRLGYNLGKFAADDRDYDRFVEGSDLPIDFETSFSQLHLRLDWNLLGKYKTFYNKDGERLSDSLVMLNNQPLYDRDGEMYSADVKRKRSWSPYVAVGPALTFSNDNMHSEDINGFNAYVNRDGYNDDLTEDIGPFFTAVAGGGINFYLGESTKLGVEWMFGIPFTDYLEGISETRDPDDGDWYSMPMIKLSTSLAAKDTDGDGILDKNDKCPETPGLEKLNGCPDMDGDGITDRADKCPETPGLRALRGCPDTDGDGIADQEDDCPQLAGIEALNGCPDSDGDGVIDPEDNCPSVAGPLNLAGCPDTDGDGIIDNRDDCPTVKGVAALNGCPDSDGDGIMDDNDDCPDVKGVKENNGCPPVVKEEKVVIEKKDQEVLDFAMENIEFETNSDVLTANSLEILKNVGDVLNKYPALKIRIQGHTDNVGRAEYNQELSQKRAKSCWDYLYQTAKVPASRMSYIGYGETKPIASNDTAEGRQKNRRVEFTVAQ